MAEINVLMVTETFPPNCGGGGWSTYHLAKALNKTDEVNIDVLAVNQEEVKDEGLKVETISVNRFPNELAYYQIYKEVKKRKDDYDIIQGQHSLTIPPLGLINDKPTVGIIRDYWPVCYRTTLRDRWGNNHLKCGTKCMVSTIVDWKAFSSYKFVNHFIRKSLAKRNDRLVSISNFVANRLQEAGFEETPTIPDLVQDKEKEVTKSKGKGDITYFGKMMPHKGPQVLLEAIPHIIDEYPEQQFVFMGMETKLLDLEKRAERLDVEENIKILGYVSSEELEQRIKGAKAVVHPAQWHEPLSMSRIEALSLGKAIISTKTGSAEEILSDGENGLLFDGSEELADKIIDIQDDELRSMIEENARKTYLEKYSEDKLVDEWSKLYHKLN